MKKISLILLGLIVTSLLALFVFNTGVSLYIRHKIPASGKFVDVGGTKIHYVEQGTGPAIVFIHGLNGAAANFSFALMKEFPPGHRLVALDRPGSGYSDRIACADANLPQQARFVAAFIEKLKLGKVSIVGHSLGGAIALQLAVDRPDLVKDLVLLSPLTQFQREIPKPFQVMEIRSNFYRWFFARFFSTPHSIMNEKETLRSIFPTGEAPKGFASQGGGYVSADHISFYHAACDLAGLEAHLAPLSERYSQLKIPISILYGTEDQILNYRLHGEGLKARLPNVHLETMSGGHMLLVTDPKKSAQFIIDSISGRLIP